MEHLDGLLKLADKEFAAIEKNGQFRTREEIDTAYKLVDIVKDVYCIWDYEGGGHSEDNGMYHSGRSYRGMSYGSDGSYDNSYGRRRDSMGRYASGDGKEEYIANLRSMAEEAPDDRTRNNINRMIREIERS